MVDTLINTLYSCIPIICTSLMALFTYRFKDEREKRREQMQADKERDAEIRKVLENQEEQLSILKEHTEQIKEISEKQIVSLEDKLKVVGMSERELLAYFLTRLHAQLDLQKKITTNQRREWDKMFNIYQNLGGNGLIADMDAEVRELDIDDTYVPINPHVVELQNAIARMESEQEELKKSVAPKKKTTQRKRTNTKTNESNKQ